MAVPHARQPEPEPEPENRDKQYVAPCEIPAARVPDKELEGAKVVLNIPDATRGRGVAEERARRRAPTVKIARADVETAVIRPVGGRDELTVPDQAAIRIPIDVTIDDPDLLADIHAQSGGATPRPGYIAPARPISDSPPARRGQSSRPPSSGRALEPPATAVPVGFAPPRKSRAPWVLLGIAALSGAGAAAVLATRGGVGPMAGEAPAAANAADTATAASTATAAQTTTSTASDPTAVAAATASSPSEGASSTEPSSEVASATSSASGPGAGNTAATLASLPTSRTPPSKATPAVAPNPPTTAPPRPTYRPPAARTSDIPDGI